TFIYKGFAEDYRLVWTDIRFLIHLTILPSRDMKKTKAFFLQFIVTCLLVIGGSNFCFAGDTMTVNWQGKIDEAIRNKQDRLLPSLYFNLAFKKYESL